LFHNKPIHYCVSKIVDRQRRSFEKWSPLPWLVLFSQRPHVFLLFQQITRYFHLQLVKGRVSRAADWSILFGRLHETASLLGKLRYSFSIFVRCRFTHIVLDKVRVRSRWTGHTDISVMFLATLEGSIFKMAVLPVAPTSANVSNQVCLIEVIKLSDQSPPRFIRSMQILGDSGVSSLCYLCIDCKTILKLLPNG
jgi:hypothetical protein